MSLAIALAGEGTVLAIEGPRFYTDLAAVDGLSPGDTILIYRQVEVSHNGRALSDPFYLGEARVVEVGETLSLLQGDPNLMLSVGVGDLVTQDAVLRPEPPKQKEPETVAGPETSTVVEERIVEVVPEDVQDYTQVVATSLTLSPDEQRATLEAWLERWPDSALAPAVQQQLAGAAPVEALAPPLRLVAGAAGEVAEGGTLAVSVVVPDVQRVDSAQLFFRREGETAFRQRAMVSNGDRSWMARVPEETTVYPAIEWYVAVQDTDGAVHESAPVLVAVTRDLPGEGPQGRSSELALRYEYVEFWWLNPGLDRFHHGEGEFTYRMRFPVLHAFRVGFGVYSGVSGYTRQLDGAQDQQEREDLSLRFGYRYGYTELEAHPVPSFGLSLRTSVGLDPTGLSGGLQGRVRLGYEESTSLQLGAGYTESTGNEFLVALAWNTVPRVPMLASVIVTDLPVGNYGVRLVYEPRFELRPALELGVRLGYQLRNTNHLGPSVGAAMAFKW